MFKSLTLSYHLVSRYRSQRLTSGCLSLMHTGVYFGALWSLYKLVPLIESGSKDKHLEVFGVTLSLSVAIAGVVALFGIRLLLLFVHNRYQTQLESRMAIDLRQGFLHKFWSFGRLLEGGKNAGELLNIYVDQIDAAISSVRSFTQVIFHGLLVVSLAVLALFMSLQFSLLFFTAFSVLAIVFAYLQLGLRSEAQNLTKNYEMLNLHLVEDLFDFSPIRTMGQHGHRMKKHLMTQKQQAGALAQICHLRSFMTVSLELGFLFVIIALAFYFDQGSARKPLGGLWILPVGMVFLRMFQSVRQIFTELASLNESYEPLKAVTQWCGLETSNRCSKLNESKAGSSESEQVRLISLDVAGQSNHRVEPLKEIEFNNVFFRYQPMPALISNLSFRVSASETLRVSGINGSGKSSLCHMILGSLQPNAGEVRLFGKKGCQTSVDEVSKALVDSELGLPRESVVDFICCGRAELKSQVFRFIQMVGLESRLARVQETPVSLLGLSAGEVQRLKLARALVGRPNILVLDEGLCHIDFDAVRSLFISIRNFLPESIIVLVDHREGKKDLCDINLVLGQVASRSVPLSRQAQISST